MPHHFHTQARVPAGDSRGGQWTDEGGGVQNFKDAGTAIRKAASDSAIDTEDWVNNVDGLLAADEASGNKYYGTQEFYDDGNGNYIPERQAMQNEIISNYIKGGSTTLGTSYFLGGAAATGKTTVAGEAGNRSNGIEKLPDNILTIDPDKFKAAIPEYQDLLGKKDPRAAKLTHEESSTMTKIATRAAADNKWDVLVDAVGNEGYEKMAAKVQQQRDNGKRVEGIYMTVDTNEGIRRADDRYKKALASGKPARKIQDDVQKRQHKGVSAIFPKFVQNKTFDRLVLYDNNGVRSVKIFEQINGVSTIYNQDAYTKFLNKANE